MQTRSKALLEPLSVMASSVGGEIGHAFLERVVTALRDVMSAELVLITLGEGRPPQRARAVFALQNGAPAENIEYDVEGTPCKFVYEGKVITIPFDLARRFPVEDGFEGYIGVPVCGDDGTVIGHFAVVSAAPIASPETAESIVRIFGARIEADFRHQTLSDERERLISDLVRSNETLRERSQALHDANKFKTGLMGMIAHDLRNPLSVLVAKAELLQARLERQGFDREKGLGDIAKVLASADRLTGIIEATLTRCRDESGQIALRKRRTDLSALARVAIETNQREAERKGIQFSAPVGAAVWGEVDEGLCLEALDNLISNAVKYSPAHTRVEVAVVAGDGSIEIFVADQGQGLSSEDLSRAFQPFQTLSAQPTGGETATGLGLSNVRQIVEAHGGEIRAESPGIGQGATFTIHLPVSV
ncbi:MAG: HAMP domain-containing sensor histidine kinase [Pseudomonadota bacterium]